MIKLIIFGLMLFTLPLTVCGQINSVLDKSTVLVPQAEFHDLVSRASFTDSSACSIEQVNMRLTDSGVLNSRAILEIDFAIKVINNEICLVPCLLVKDGSLTLLSATGDSGPVNVRELAGAYTVTVNKEGLHRVKLMFSVDPMEDSMGYLTAMTLALPEAGQAWCRIDMNNPSIQLLESFGNLEKNIVRNSLGFSSSSFIKERSSIRLAWSRRTTGRIGDGAAAIFIPEGGRIASFYLYPLEGSSSGANSKTTDSEPNIPILFKMDKKLELSGAIGYKGLLSSSNDRDIKSVNLSVTGSLDFERCGDYLLITPDSSCKYLGLKVIAGTKVWRNAGKGRFSVVLPIVSGIEAKTTAWISGSRHVNILSVASLVSGKFSVPVAAPIPLSDSEKRFKEKVIHLSGMSAQMKRSLLKRCTFSWNEDVSRLRMRILSSSLEGQKDLALSGFEANIFPSSNGESIIVHERFGIINNVQSRKKRGNITKA